MKLLKTFRTFQKRCAMSVLSKPLPTRRGAAISHFGPLRYLSTSAAPERQEVHYQQENIVRETLKKMILDKKQEDEDLKPISDDELKQRFQSFQNFYDEAKLCIGDCEDAGEHLEEETQTALAAVDTAFAAYVDLLEDLRRADDQQLQSYNDERLQNATNLKSLRQELDKLKQE